jgi:hypothetical protein
MVIRLLRWVERLDSRTTIEDLIHGGILLETLLVTGEAARRRLSLLSAG